MSNNWNTYTSFIKSIKFNKKDVPNIEYGACWRHTEEDRKTSEFMLIRIHKSSKNKKFTEKIVEIINTITPCKYHEFENVKYITIKLLKNYYSGLIILNLIRLIWYSPLAAYEDKYLKELCESFDKGEEKDAMLLITSLIELHLSKDAKLKSYYIGDHCFFYKKIIPISTEKLLSYKKNNNKSMKDILCS